MKHIIRALLSIFISHTVIEFNLHKTHRPQRSTNESTAEENQAPVSAVNPTENSHPTDYYGSGNHIYLNTLSSAISRASTVLDSPTGYGSYRNLANDNHQTSPLSCQHRGEVTTGQSSYKRVFVGKNSSGSDIYTSSRTLKRAKSLAKNVRIVNGIIEIFQNRSDVRTDGRCSANPSPSPSTKRKRRSREYDEGTREGLPVFGRTFNSVLELSFQESVEHNLQHSETGEPTGFTVSKRKVVGTSTDCAKSSRDSLKSLSGQMTLNSNRRLTYDYFRSSNHKTLINSSGSSFGAPVIFGNVTITRSLQTPGTSCSLDSERPSSPCMESNSPTSDVRPVIPPGRFFRLELESESSNSTSGQHCSLRLETRDAGGREFILDDSTRNFVAAVRDLQILIADMDVFFGSARRLRTSLVERPHESGNIIEDISNNLRIMTCLDNPAAIERFGTVSDDRLIILSDSMMHFTEEMWGHIAAANCENGEVEHEIVKYLLSILRELRNEASAVVESAQPVLEFFMCF